ncbi:MAG: hypothetical protein IH984_12065 [Planctomycetes bacterium]|nr:hypothetical protein [Planctomycetota bacterium]
MLFLELYRRLDLLQRKFSFRIAVSIVILLTGSGLFGALLVKSSSINSQRLAIESALRDQNLINGDFYALSLNEIGTITVNGRTYGGQIILDNKARVFDEAGNIRNPMSLADFLVSDQQTTWLPEFLLKSPSTTWMLGLITIAWLMLIVWMGILIPFLLTLLGTAIPVSICWMFGNEAAMLAFAGMGLLTFTFVLLSRVMLIIFSGPYQVFAVAHTIIKEATRSRISLVFVILLLILLPMLPMWLDPDTPLRFRLQTFISRSLTLTYVLAACMTLFLSCATVAFEIRDRQIWHLMTKPLNKMNYLIGKWLGVMSVNLILLIVSGVSIFSYIQYLRQLPVVQGQAGVDDRIAVDHEILTARIGKLPDYITLSGGELRDRVKQLIERDPDLSRMKDIPNSRRVKLAKQIQEDYLIFQRNVPPAGEGSPGPNQQTYIFTGLNEAKNLQTAFSLRYRFHILRDDEHEKFPVAFVFNDHVQAAIFKEYIPTVPHVLTIPVTLADGTPLIDANGTLRVTVVNLYETSKEQRGRGSLNFDAEDFELLYKVGSFEGNFVRSVMFTWVKLAFLSMLGLACASLLNFPVACLMCFTIFIAGSMGSYLAESINYYYPRELSQMDWSDIGMVIVWAFKTVIRAIAQSVEFLLRQFSAHDPAGSLVEGRAILWSSLASGIFWLGIVWSGIAMLFGYLVLRTRQLAIYSGHG